MKNLKTLLLLSVTILSLSIVFYSFVSSSFAANTSKQDRAKIKSDISFENDAIINALIDPMENIQVPMLKKVEDKNEIKIIDATSLNFKKWINSILNSPEHLSKISLGYKVVKLNCAIDSDSATLSMLSSWKKRRLDNSKITISLFYDRCAKTEAIYVK